MNGGSSPPFHRSLQVKEMPAYDSAPKTILVQIDVCRRRYNPCPVRVCCRAKI